VKQTTTLEVLVSEALESYLIENCVFISPKLMLPQRKQHILAEIIAPPMSALTAEKVVYRQLRVI
jgi:hypothetical protein